ncbi:MAG: DUF2933 domain-containing protein [Candidatus Dormibacteria bacterium]
MEHFLPYLVLLICPISMGGMMLVMMRGGKQPPGRNAVLERRVSELERDLEAASGTDADTRVRAAQ